MMEQPPKIETVTPAHDPKGGKIIYKEIIKKSVPTTSEEVTDTLPIHRDPSNKSKGGHVLGYEVRHLDKKTRKFLSKEYIPFKEGQSIIDSAFCGVKIKSEKYKGLFERYVLNEAGETLFLNYENASGSVVDPTRQDEKERQAMKDYAVKIADEDSVAAHNPASEMVISYEDNLEQSQDTFPENYAKSRWEHRNDDRTEQAEKMIADIEEEMKGPVMLMNYILENPDKEYEMMESMTRSGFGDHTLEEIEADKKGPRLFLEESVSRYKEDLVKMQARIDTLRIHPEILNDRDSYEKMLDDGKKLQQWGRQSLDQFNSRQHVLRNLDSLYIKIDAEKEWMNRVLRSPEYLQKLKEYEKLTVQDLVERLQRLNKNDYKIGFAERGYSETIEDDSGHVVNVNFETGDATKYTQGPHEFEHLVTDGNAKMSQYAIDLYTKAIDHEAAGRDYEDDILLEDDPSFTGPSEADARKKFLEYDLERLGVWRYGEVFTNEHYKKALELMEQKKLGPNAVQFLRIIKPEYITQIMNTIAMIEQEQKDIQEMGNQSYIQYLEQMAALPENERNAYAHYLEAVNPGLAKELKQNFEEGIG